MSADDDRSRELAVAELDLLPQEAALELFRGCCAASAWTAAMVAERPFRSVDAIQGAAACAFDRLGEGDWLEAFAAHPRIGDLETLRARYGQGVEGQEQASTVGAASAVLEALAAGNAEYQRRFGFVFLVKATGKTAEQMLSILRRRLGSDRQTELATATDEQRKITALRLERLLGPRDR